MLQRQSSCGVYSVLICIASVDSDIAIVIVVMRYLPCSEMLQRTDAATDCMSGRGDCRRLTNAGIPSKNREFKFSFIS